MRSVFLVFLGGGFGSVLRYLTVLGMQRWLGSGLFPWGVFTANVLGSFILGWLCVLPVMKAPQGDLWLLLATGMLGGYTTFSTLSLLLGLAAAALGWHLGRWSLG
jgi:fluoride exporter